MNKVDHIAVAVKDLDEAIKVYRDTLGLELSGREVVEAQGVEVAFFPLEGFRLELITPIRKDSPISNFLEKRGGGLHHICFQVEDIESELRRLEEKGVELVSSEPGAGSKGRKVAFLHPRATFGALIELIE